MWRVESGMRKAPKFVIARALRARGALSAKREEVPLGCNLLQQLANSPRHSCYLPLYCEIATSACGLLAMTNLKASRRRMRAAKIASMQGARSP